jgi:hypothetical protein
MSTSLDVILNSLAKHYNPASLHHAPQGKDRVPFLALHLAKHGVLVLVASVPTAYQQQSHEVINDWVTTYRHFYNVLTDALFPSLRALNIQNYQDNPAIVVMEGKCAPVIEAFANVVVPYISANTHSGQVNFTELRGILNFILEDLEGLDLKSTLLQHVMVQGTAVLSHLLELPLKQYSLTSFSRTQYQIIPQLPPAPPETPRKTGTLPDLPQSMPPQAPKVLSLQDEPPTSEGQTEILPSLTDRPLKPPFSPSLPNARSTQERPRTLPVPKPKKKED